MADSGRGARRGDLALDLHRLQTVEITRFDGGPPLGPFSFNTAVTVPAGAAAAGVVSGNSASFPIILVPAPAKGEPSLRQARLPLTATGEVVFQGRDLRNQRVEAQGAVTIIFVNEGTEPDTPSC